MLCCGVQDNKTFIRQTNHRGERQREVLGVPPLMVDVLVQDRQAPMVFKRRGFVSRLVASKWPFAVYAICLADTRSQPQPSNDAQERPLCWEVHKMRWNPERVLSGAILEPAARLASDEDWGKLGFTFSTLEAAMKKYEELSTEE